MDGLLRLAVPAVLLTLAACASAPSARPESTSTAELASTTPVAAPSTVPTSRRLLDVDTSAVTAAGNTFVAPAGWTLDVRGTATVLEAPEGGSVVVLVDLHAEDADAAVAAAWKAFKPVATWPLKVVTPAAPRDGWTNRRTYSYQTSPNEQREVLADVRRANGVWTVALYDVANDVGEKRGAQVGLIFGKLLPKGYQRESFAGKSAQTLDDKRIADLSRFVHTAMALTGVPGVSVGLYQDGRPVFVGGFGVRELGKKESVDENTRFMIASNTKALTTLMLARLVDQGKLGWESPAVSLLPTFKLGDAATTNKVLVKHLICACTGMPRQDMEWLLEFKDMTPESAMTLLGTMQPTSPFGELFQYSNPMAAAAGYIGGHVAFPGPELGAAYDAVMQAQVFGPLGMKDTTDDFDLAQHGNFAAAHAPTIDGKMALAEGSANLSIVPVRPAGGAWSTVNDMLKYVAMELAEGKLPNGQRYVSRTALLERRVPQVVVSTDITYGMGLMVDTVYGTQVVHHGGDMIGFHSDMIWLPEHGVGAVILTNGDPGWLIRSVFRRKLLEVLFDGRPEADEAITAQSKAFYEEIAADRRLLTVPADPAVVRELAPLYSNPAVGEVTVISTSPTVRFDFGEWASEVASRRNPDGTDSIITTTPGVNGFEFVKGQNAGKRTLTLRDAQHEYVLLEK